MDTQYIHRVLLGMFNRSTKEITPFEMLVIYSIDAKLSEREFEENIQEAYPTLKQKELQSLVVLSSFVTCK